MYLLLIVNMLQRETGRLIYTTLTVVAVVAAAVYQARSLSSDRAKASTFSNGARAAIVAGEPITPVGASNFPAHTTSSDTADVALEDAITSEPPGGGVRGRRRSGQLLYLEQTNPQLLLHGVAVGSLLSCGGMC